MTGRCSGSVRRIRTVGIEFGLLITLSAAAVGRAQPITPPRQEQQSPPGMMGPGMMRGPMMPMMGDMHQMMQMCAQRMNQMTGAKAPPAQPGPQTK